MSVTSIFSLKRAKAMLRVKEKEFKAAESLKNRGLQGEVAFATAQAALVDARANLSNVETALKNTKVRAPFDGILDHRFVEVGDFVGVGDPIATIIDLEKLVIEADVSERHIQYLKEAKPLTFALSTTFITKAQFVISDVCLLLQPIRSPLRLKLITVRVQCRRGSVPKSCCL